MDIKIYTDGACSGNPGPGGWACILSTTLPDGRKYETRHSGGFRLTTNNRMELLAVIRALSFLNGSHNVEVISDSKYVCDAFNNNWIESWRVSNWKNRTLINRDMWQTLNNLVSMQHSVKFTWIKGHSVNQFNNECDKMAVLASKDRAHFDIDYWYEENK